MASAVGHLYGLYTRERGYPVYSYQWTPLHEVDGGARFQKPYFNLLRKLSSSAGLYVNACDYDIEGSVIGYLVILYMGDVARARRMKYSTLTIPELRSAWRSLGPLDKEMVEAGLARHEVDWLWGINISRALMDHARRASGKRVILSAGRVQSPTLVKAYKDWLERGLHIPDPQFNVIAVLDKDGVRFTAYLVDKPRTAGEARSIAAKIKSDGKLRVLYVERKPQERSPPPPFNLPDLQSEAARIYGYSPSETQKLAEDLYLAAAISYPRTNSQKLPPTIGYRRIIESLSENSGYREYTGPLLSKPVLRPREGRRDDPAHPAIYPTGVKPEGLTARHMRIYDLIVRRFLSTFSDPAVVVRTGLKLYDLSGRHEFRAEGTVVTRPGWLSIYTHATPEEKVIPPLVPGELVDVVDARDEVEWGKSSVKPLSRIGLVRWMEKVGIGTEATRARIVETLYRRGYLKRSRGGDEVTMLGIGVARLLMSVFPQLSTPDLTRRLEEDLEDIRRGRKTRSEVVDETKKIITSLLREYSILLESEKALRIAEEAGLVETRSRCALCNMPAEDTVGGVPLCRHHMEAFNRLKKSIKDIASRLGYPAERALPRIKKASGKLVSDIIEEAARNKGLLRELAG